MMQRQKHVLVTGLLATKNKTGNNICSDYPRNRMMKMFYALINPVWATARKDLTP